MNPIRAWFQISLAKRVLILAIVISLPLLIAVGGIYIATAPQRQLGRCYNRLHLGQTKQQVEAVFERRPDYRCLFENSEIWYYSPVSTFPVDMGSNALPNGARYRELRDLPDVYDNVQLAFDRNGALHAYTHIGEELHVTSTRGPVKGSHFKVLARTSF